MTAIESTASTTTVWNLDPTHAEVAFAVRHLMIATVRGRFGAVQGTVTFDETNPSNSKVDATVDVTSIDTRQEMRDNHLKSADFFDVEHYPTMRFVSKRIEGDVKGEFRVIGDLTIRDVTREITLKVVNEGQAVDPWGNVKIGITATGKLNRSDYGLTWNVALEAGGVTVGEEVKLSIEAELVRQSAGVSAAA